MKYNKINHSRHRHELILKHNECPYICDGCHQLGFSACYQCEKKCNFHLHEECAMPESSIYPRFFDKQEFNFFETAPDEMVKVCDACVKDINVSDCRYRSRDGIYDLHPCCANLKHTISFKTDQEERINLKLRKSASSKWFFFDTASAKCLECEKKAISDNVKGWCYATSSGDHCYHVACINDMVLDVWKKNHLNNYSSLALMEILASGQEIARSNKGSSSFGKKAIKFCKFLWAIISAILFGEPTTLLIHLAENLISN